jgi:hypothetical protein
LPDVEGGIGEILWPVAAKGDLDTLSILVDYLNIKKNLG